MNPRRKFPPPCPACPEGATGCLCWAKEARADREAQKFAAVRGVALEREDHKIRVCGDRFPSFEQRRSLAERMIGAKVLREYRMRARLRIEQAERTVADISADIARLRDHVKFLDLMFDGDGKFSDEIAAHYGRKSHSFFSDKLREIRVAATRIVPIDVSPPCQRPGCPNRIPEHRIHPGRRRAKYCSDSCRGYVSNLAYRERRINTLKSGGERKFPRLESGCTHPTT